MQRNHGAAKPAVADEQIRAQTEKEQRLGLLGLLQEFRKIRKIGGNEKPFCPASGAPADVARHRLVEPQFAANPFQVEGFGHVHASWTATLPIEPAPMVRTTSPSRAVRMIASGIPAMSST